MTIKNIELSNDYIVEVIGSKESVEDSEMYKNRMKKILSSFLNQKRSVSQLYEDAEDAVDSAFENCGSREKEYCAALGIDKSIRRKVLSGRSENMQFWNGYKDGKFFTVIEIMYGLDSVGIKSLLSKRGDSPMLDELYSKVIDTQGKYRQEMNRSFEDYEIVVKEHPCSYDQHWYTAELPEIGGPATGILRIRRLRMRRRDLQRFIPKK